MTLKHDLESVGTAWKQNELDAIAERLGLVTLAGKEFLRFQLANTLQFDRKQHDYGSKNISAFGLFGVVVRMNDKFERVKNLFLKKRRAKVNESIQDNLRDVSVYGVIALMLDQGRWPNE